MERVVAAGESGGLDAAGALDGGTDPLVLVLFAAILLAICWQNWFLARRAEGKSLIPDWLRRPGGHAD
jgi:hypothetical protein